MITYNELTPEAKDVILIVKQRFEDCFDSDSYGPFVKNWNRFDDNRLAVLLDIAIGNIMMSFSQPASWTVGTYPYGTPSFKQGAVLALTIEVINHLIRSYVEMPDTSRVGAPDVVRRDYLNRWQGTLGDYKEQMKLAIKKMSIDMYNLNAENGNYQSVLIDLPSMSGWNWPIG